MNAMDALHALEVPPFEPPPLLRSGHLQTIVGPTVPVGRGDAGERVRVPIEGGALIGHLHRTRGARACLLVLHGIAGTAHEPFVLRIARVANARGMDALRLHLRGAGESRHCGPTPLYHAGLTDDVRAALRFMLARYERAHAVGYSLGGQLVLRALGEWSEQTPSGMASVTAVSPPLDLAECADFAEGPQAALYRAYIVRTLKARYRVARSTMGDGYDASHSRRVRSVRTIREYDAAVVAPYFGYRDVLHYYQSTSSGDVVDRIRVPTLVLHAEDDPLVTVAPIERLRHRALPHVRTVITRHGGHVGFLAAKAHGRDETRFWAGQRAIDLAAATS